MTKGMGSLEDVKDLLKNPDGVNRRDFLDVLIKLEREHAVTLFKVKIGLGFSEEMINVWKIAKIANRIRIKVEKELDK